MTDPGMSSPQPQTSVFLERHGYRRRRLMDAARLLPLAGALLFAVPLLWPTADAPPQAGAPEPVRMSEAVLYIFAVWAGLIAASVLFGIAARAFGHADEPQGTGRD